MENIFFFQTEQITEDTNIFNEFKKKIFYSYFQVDEKYYLFMYAEKSIDINFLSNKLIQELYSKQRKIRSFRGFILYALEIMKKGKDYEILHTNLQPFFWRKVKDIIGKNQKSALLKFLFPNYRVNEYENQIELLQKKVAYLENTLTLIMKFEENQNNPNRRYTYFLLGLNIKLIVKFLW